MCLDYDMLACCLQAACAIKFLRSREISVLHGFPRRTRIYQEGHLFQWCTLILLTHMQTNGFLPQKMLNSARYH